MMMMDRPTVQAAVLAMSSAFAARMEAQRAIYREVGASRPRVIRAIQEFEIDQAHVDALWPQLERYSGDGNAEADLLRTSIANSGAEFLVTRAPFELQIRRLTEALEIARRTSDRRLEARLLTHLANAEGYTSRPRCDLYEQVVEILESVGDPSLLAEALYNSGVCVQTIGYPDQASALFKRALMEAERGGSSVTVAHTLIALSNLKRRANDMSGAERDLLKAMAELETQSVTTALQGEVYRFMGLLRIDQDRLDDAAEMFERQLQVGKDCHDRRQMSSALSLLGTVSFRRSDLREALSLYARGAALAEEFGSTRLQAIALGNMGEVYVALSEFAEALSCHELALSLFRDFGDLHGVANELVNGADIHRHLHHTEEARALALEALSMKTAGPAALDAARRLVDELGPHQSG